MAIEAVGFRLPRNDVVIEGRMVLAMLPSSGDINVPSITADRINHLGSSPLPAKLVPDIRFLLHKP